MKTRGVFAEPNTSGLANRTRFHGTAAAAFCLVMAGIGFMPNASADQFDKKTVVTFNTPVEVPGKALPAGTYVFRLLDSSSNRNIVQIFDKDQKQLYATILALPDYRLKPADKPIILFDERPAGMPPAVRAFFYPGDNYGQHLVYPHDRAVELAKQNKRHVLSMRNEMAQNITTPATSASQASVQELQKTDVSGVNSDGETVPIAVVIQVEP